MTLSTLALTEQERRSTLERQRQVSQPTNDGTHHGDVLALRYA
jgi:hypothetical protein